MSLCSGWMVKSKVKNCPRVLKQSKRMYVPRMTAMTPIMKEGVIRILACGGRQMTDVMKGVGDVMGRTTRR